MNQYRSSQPAPTATHVSGGATGERDRFAPGACPGNQQHHSNPSPFRGEGGRRPDEGANVASASASHRSNPSPRPSLLRGEGEFRGRLLVPIFAFLLMFFGDVFTVADAAESSSSPSATWQRVVLLQDAQTRIVFLGTTLLGICGGLVGVFMLLRKQALIGDVVGHSALPGIAIAFIICEIMNPGGGRNLPALITGAFLSSLAGAICVMLIERYSPLRADAAMAMTLSLFYGLGAALFTVIMRIPTASAAGLSSYLNGKTATLVVSDVWIFGIAAATLSLLTLLLLKELSLVCFDDDFASSTGWPVRLLDGLLVGMVVSVTIIGMQTVGLILVVAILIIPAASAQFWTDDLRKMLAASAALGAVSAGLGTIISALAPKLAAGPVIVLCGSFLFVISLLLGPQHGFFWIWRDRRRTRRKMAQYDLLRACYEWRETASSGADVTDLQLISTKFSTENLLPMRSWSLADLNRSLARAQANGLIQSRTTGQWQLTPDGAALARRSVRNHRLWELYLITYADTAPANADYHADQIEHVLGADLMQELELRLARWNQSGLPASPHALNPSTGPDAPSQQ